MKTVVLVLDRLHLGYLGPYGNTWIETPALDRLAAESTVFDQFFISGSQLDHFYRAAWFGRHPLRLGEDDPARALPRLATAAGLTSTLLTDEPLAADLPAARAFDERVELETPETETPVESIEETHSAHGLAQLIDRVERAGERSFLWCHLQGLAAPWDAPLEFRRAFADETDPDPPTSAVVPNVLLPNDFDPDIVLGHSLAYAGQIVALDQCLGALLEVLDDETLLVVVSPRGFPLGEHRRVGACDEALYAELVHTPLFVRMPRQRGWGVRVQTPVEPGDLWATLADAWGISLPQPADTGRSLLPLIDADVESLRDRHVIVGESGALALLTPAWYLRADERDELFVRPDDCRHVNEVASRCPQVVELLRSELARLSQTLQVGSSVEYPPLDDILVYGLE